MTLRLNSTGGGYVEIDAPNTASNFSLTAPTANGTLDTTGRAGNILQVVSATTSTEVSNTTTTYVDTGLSATITPASTANKILVIIDQSWNANRGVSDPGFGLKILRNSTTIHEPQTTSIPLTWYIDVGTNPYGRTHMTILDSPSSTSAVVYKTQGRPSLTTNSGVVNFQPNISTPGTSRIILMEVAG